MSSHESRFVSPRFVSPRFVSPRFVSPRQLNILPYIFFSLAFCRSI